MIDEHEFEQLVRKAIEHAKFCEQNTDRNGRPRSHDLDEALTMIDAIGEWLGLMPYDDFYDAVRQAVYRSYRYILREKTGYPAASYCPMYCVERVERELFYKEMMTHK